MDWVDEDCELAEDLKGFGIMDDQKLGCRTRGREM